MEYVLETPALQKRYRSFAALDGCTMHVPKGAIYGFVGRNGAGKTTLIRLICGLREPSAGSYTLFGVKNTDAQLARCRRRMGAVVETPSIYLDMTAEENLRQQYRVLGVPSDDGARALLHLVGLSDTGSRKAKNLSLGMRTPLTAICGYLDLLNQEPHTENARRYLSVIRERTDAMRAMAQELFQYSLVSSTANGSTGLGLSIAKLLTEKRGGRIWAAYENETLQVCVDFPQ